MVEIGGLNIRQLSGPTTFTYLFPKREAFEENAEKGIFLPIIILLGDTHYSEDSRCEPCEEEKGCFLVESDTFLSTLDTIAKKYPVDVYTEYAPKKLINEKGGVLFHRFIGKTSGCYETALRGTKRYRCNFPNIRWHYADARFWKNKVEGEAIEVSNYLNFLKGPKADLQEDYRLQIPTPIFKKFLFRMLEASHKDETMAILSRRWAGLMKEALFKTPNSMVYKQIKKSNIEVSIDHYCYYSLQCHRLATEEKIGSKQDLSNLCLYIFSGNALPGDLAIYKKLIEKVFIFWVKFTACLLDMYFIARMLKTPKDNINSYVTVAFFGHEHATAISNFLQYDVNWYELKYSTNESDRCIRVNGHINFNEDLSEYSKMRVLYLRRGEKFVVSKGKHFDTNLYQNTYKISLLGLKSNNQQVG